MKDTKNAFEPIQLTVLQSSFPCALQVSPDTVLLQTVMLPLGHIENRPRVIFPGTEPTKHHHFIAALLSFWARHVVGGVDFTVLCALSVSPYPPVRIIMPSLLDMADTYHTMAILAGGLGQMLQLRPGFVDLPQSLVTLRKQHPARVVDCDGAKRICDLIHELFKAEKGKPPNVAP